MIYRSRQKLKAILLATLISVSTFATTIPVGAQRKQDVWTADCPSTVECVVVPAAYNANNGDVGDYGNYDETNRTKDMAINSIIIHDTEGSLQDTLDHFKDSTAYASVQYVVDRDGTIYQMVQNKNMGWHAANWWYNMHSIGIEHIGYAADSGSYTPEMYKASAELVKHLTSKYNIPRDRGHIIGHDNVPAINGGGQFR